MFGLGMGEMVVIVVIAIVLFGTTDLPKNLRKAAKGFNEFKKVANDAQRQFNEVRDDVARTIMNADLEEKAKEKAARVAELHAGEASVEGGHGVGSTTDAAHGTVTETSVYTASSSAESDPSRHGVGPSGPSDPADPHGHHHDHPHDHHHDHNATAASDNPAAAAPAATVAAAGMTTAASGLPAIRPAEGVVARSSHEAPVDHSDAHHEERGKEPREAPAAALGVSKPS